MFLEAVILGVIIGIVRNGSMRNISMLKIRGWYLIILALLLQMFTMFFSNISIVKTYGNYFYVTLAVLIILTLIINLDKKAVWIILIGALLNFLIILMNGFKMPISFQGLELAGLETMIDGIKSGSITNYMSLDEVSNWTKYFGKYITIPKPYPFAKVISIGDIFMSLGVIFFVQGEMIKTYLTTKNRMIRMGYRGKI